MAWRFYSRVPHLLVPRKIRYTALHVCLSGFVAWRYTFAFRFL
ncbi:hypothetical protein HPTD01_2441 [Halomonas sp. TD01]|nr:hypothetical protein HPTD01_2441 [Halomonas sp. TD01]